jgi:hypothetical protein
MFKQPQTKEPANICECCKGTIQYKKICKRGTKTGNKRTLYCINCADYIDKVRRRLRNYYIRKIKKVINNV